MLLGIDVGGTFTDAVLIADGAIVQQAKVATTQEQILTGILQALDSVLTQQSVAAIERVVISSTLVTNTLAEGKNAPVFLAVMPGPGMSTVGKFPVTPEVLTGYIDHRGQVITAPALEPERLKLNFEARVAAVSGKFAVRNPVNEQKVVAQLAPLGFEKIFSGSELSGELNFVRRTNSAYFAATVYEAFKTFATQVELSMAERKITAPLQVLKADGGTLPLAAALTQPVEAIFTGPAASVLGIAALGAPTLDAISLDVGGTTTDIAFWQNGKPLLAPKGAQVAGYNTAVRSFYLRSVGIGGDSLVTRVADVLQVGPQRSGKAMALGGAAPTLTDALLVAGLVTFGNGIAALAAMEQLTEPGETPQQVARRIIATATQTLATTITAMLKDWRVQPVYTVNDIMNGTPFEPQLLIGVGGGAPGLVTQLGQELQLPVQIPSGAMVANAVGAALARPTLTGTLRADTTEGFYSIPEAGLRKRLPATLQREQAEAILKSWLLTAAQRWQMPTQDVETLSYEEFFTLHDSYTTGKIITLKMQLQPGILHKITGREVAF
ncbi:MAG: hydantoinase/oxoprolinase family protein [Acidaminococcaceae bacterium]